MIGRRASGALTVPPGQTRRLSWTFDQPGIVQHPVEIVQVFPRFPRVPRVQIGQPLLLGQPLLAPLVLYRIARGVLGKRRRAATFVASLPMLAAFTASYALGEGVGYLFGGGRSVLEVE